MQKYYYRKKKFVLLAFVIDFVGGILFGLSRYFSLKKAVNLTCSINKILLLRLDHLGDVLYVNPAISAVRKQFPKAHITLLVASWAREIVEDNPGKNEIIVYDAPWFQRGKKRGGLIQLISLIFRLRREKFDLAIDFKGYLWNIFLIYFSGAKYKVSYNDVGGKYLLDKALRRRTDLHAVLQNLEMLKLIGIPFEGKPEVSLNIQKKEMNEIDGLLRKLDVNKDKMIAIHCGAGRESKRWPMLKFNDLINRLFKMFPDYEVVLIGGKDEEKLISEMTFALRQPKSLVGKTDIKELAAFLKKCKLFIGNDSAPAHLSAVTGTPTIVLFSKEDDPIQWKPWGEKVIVLQKEPHQFRYLSDSEIKASLEKIAVDDVLAAIKKTLG